ncbi:uncharacterized protein Aud_008828 [Aspergillus udagawae]|uniref:Uncharacterized protein n=1 Tax=Aspergillus udagawae TaxID=91492 RepID=A0A8E0QXX2_9EURO|nr:uncharacterized protein Aud_008828 [Aspergillus udagawae]GIC92362.1 hypothetical protein Aud_008828 [Aspergillus udagawae]
MASQTPPILSMQEAYLVPYGAIGFASDIVTLYMVTCLLFGRAPLCPARRIRNIRSAKFLIGFWIFNIYMMNKYNVEQCWQYWELVLINVSNGVMGALVALVGFFMVGSWDPPVKGEAKENDPESSPALGAVSLSAPEEEAAVPDERICDSARKYGTMADMPSSGLNRISRISRLSLSNTQGQSNSTCDVCPQMSEVTRELNSMANEPAQPVDKVKFGYLAVLGVYIGAVLIGSIPLARLAVLEGKVSSKKICLIFGILGGLTILGILFTVVYEFCYLGKGTGPGPEHFIILFALLLMCFTDWILGCVLGSLSGVPIADINMEELSRYWFYLAITKLPMFAF